MKAILAGAVVVLLLAGLLPFGLIALARSRPSTKPPVRPIQDMAQQPKFRAQRENPMFADDRAMRPLIAGVEARDALLVPREVLNDPNHPRLLDDQGAPIALTDAAQYERVLQGTEPNSPRPLAGGGPGVRAAGPEKAVNDKVTYVARIPIPVTLDLLRRGRERFNVYCAVCHGASGYGDGIVARRAAEMQAAGADTAAGWVAPTNYHTDEIRGRPVGQIYNTIANGVRTMPAYAKQISVIDRWAIAAYVKALQRSQHAKAEDVPDTEQDKFSK